MGDILLKIARIAPIGHRYLHEKRLTSIEVSMNNIKTAVNKGVSQWKLKIARAGQISRKGG
ncbi:MAG: hypothetical protein ABIG63_01595 [Chloroflexota bacterium]